MIFGFLLVFFILFGLLLFWVVYEKIKTIQSTLRRTDESLRGIREQLNLLVDLVGGSSDDSHSEPTDPDRFSPESFFEETDENTH